MQFSGRSNLALKERGAQQTFESPGPFFAAARELCRQIARTSRSHPVVAYFLVLCFFFSLDPGLRSTSFEQEHSVLQAQAFLKGQLDLAYPIHDVAFFKGKFYQVNPPLPSFLLIPVVMLLGEHATAWYVTPFIFFCIAVQIVRLCKIFGVEANALWIVAGMLLGTGLWSCFIESAGIWFFAHLVSFACLTTALVETLGLGRGSIIGFFLACSFLCRQATLDTAVCFMGLLLWRHRAWPKRVLNLIAFGTCAMSGVLFYLYYNWVRFGDPFDTGYSYLHQSGYLFERQKGEGLFHWSYIIPNGVLMLMNGFNVLLDGKDLRGGFHMSPWGTSLTFASPFLLFSLHAQMQAVVKRILLVTVAIVALHVLSYHATGWVQINTYRYAFDFIPLLLPLCCVNLKEGRPALMKGLIAYSIGLNCIALVIVPLLNLLVGGGFR